MRRREDLDRHPAFHQELAGHVDHFGPDALTAERGNHP
jgi:hypothetical protein